MTDQPPPSNALNVARQFREALARNDMQAMSRLARAYERVYARLKDKIDLLINEIELSNPTPNQLVKAARYTSLIRQVESELRDYQVILRNEIDGVSRDAIGFAG